MLNKRPILIGLGLDQYNGGPRKTILSFNEVLNGKVVSLGDAHTKPSRDDSVEHIFAKSGYFGQRMLLLNSADRKRLARYINEASHVQCHILFRYHAHIVFKECRKTGVPYWVIPHGCLDPYVFTYRRFRKLIWMYLFGRRILSHASYVVFATQREFKKAKRWLNRDNGIVIHWPTKIPKDPRNDLARAQVRNELGISESKRLLVVLGRIHPVKRVVEAAKVFLDGCLSNAVLVIIGNIELEDPNEFNNILQKSAGKILWLGARFGDERDKILRGCDGYLSFSVKENFNHSAAEAMAMGLPIILSCGNDLCDDLMNEDVGWILSNDLRETLANALKEWSNLAESELSLRGENARLWAIKNLSNEEFQNRITTLTETLQKGKV